LDRCNALAGLVTPYYSPAEGDETTVGCVPATCGQKLGRSTDMAQGGASEAACTWNKMEDACCTDKIENPCDSGSLPCVLGKVDNLDNYNLAAVARLNEKDAADVIADCPEKGADGPVEDFAASAETAAPAPEK